MPSGARINHRKCKAMLFGNWPDQFSIAIPDFLKVPGIWFEVAKACDKNWLDRIAKVKHKPNL